jgi:hypothetical protein
MAAEFWLLICLRLEIPRKLLKPQLFLRGHFKFGIYHVNDAQVASASFPSYITAKVDDRKITHLEYALSSE